MALPWRIADLLPHAPPMILIDQVESHQPGQGVVVSVLVREESLFYQEGIGIPNHVSLEWMAQTCGVFSGIEAGTTGLPPRIGFLLGTRDFVATVDAFALGERLLVTANKVFQNNDMAMFACTVRQGDREVVTAQLSLAQPNDLATIPTGYGGKGKP